MTLDAYCSESYGISSLDQLRDRVSVVVSIGDGDRQGASKGQGSGAEELGLAWYILT